MLPGTTYYNGLNRSNSDAKAIADCSVLHTVATQLSYLFDIVCGQFCLWKVLAASLSILGHHIRNVFGLCAKKKMFWIAAGRIVTVRAIVTNTNVGGNRSVDEFPGNTMRIDSYCLFTSHRGKHSVSLHSLITEPEQTSIFSGCRQMSLEANLQRYFRADVIARSGTVFVTEFDLAWRRREHLTADETTSLDFRRFAISHDQPPLQVVCGQDGHAVTSCCPSVSLY